MASDIDAGNDLAADAEAINERLTHLVKEYTAFQLYLSENGHKNFGWVGKKLGEIEAEQSHIAAIAQNARALLQHEDSQIMPLEDEERLDSARVARQEDAQQIELGAMRARLTACNIIAHEAQWAAIKKSKGVVMGTKRIQCFPGPYGQSLQTTKMARNVTAHAMVDGGATWLRVLQTTETNLGREMAASGWEFDDEEDCDLDINGVFVASVAHDLISAARLNRHNHEHPHVRLILTRIREGHNPHIDHFLEKIRGMGTDGVTITVECANSTFVESPVPTIEDALPTMLMQPTVTLTDTVNLDTSVVVMLISDITYRRIEIEDWHGRQRRMELSHEIANPGECLREMCGVLDGKRLVCTREAAEMASKLLTWMGQDSEKIRANLILERPGEAATQTPTERLKGLQQLSEHQIIGLQLPVHVIDEEWDRGQIAKATGDGRLPEVASKVAADIREPTVSIFMYGWASGYTTVSTNMTCARQLRCLTERYRTNKDERGPAVFVLSKPRSLNSKKKEAQSPKDDLAA